MFEDQKLMSEEEINNKIDEETEDVKAGKFPATGIKIGSTTLNEAQLQALLGLLVSG